MGVLRTPDDRFAELAEAGWPYEPHYVELAGGLRVHHVDEGPADGPVVLLTHGEPTWGYLYRKMIPGLVERGYRVLAPDLVGFGRSDKPADPEDYTYERHVDWYTAWFDAFDLRDVLLFCQDWGGLIGLVDVARRPDCYRAVVAANTGVLPGVDVDLPDDAPFLRWKRFAADLRPFRASTCVGGDSPLNQTGFRLTDAEAAAYDAPFPDDDHTAGARRFPQLVPLRGDDPAAELCRDTWVRLAGFDRPFLTVVGDHEDITSAVIPLLQATIPGAAELETRIAPESGHFLQEHAPDVLVDAIADVDPAPPAASG